MGVIIINELSEQTEDEDVPVNVGNQELLKRIVRLEKMCTIFALQFAEIRQDVELCAEAAGLS